MEALHTFAQAFGHRIDDPDFHTLAGSRLIVTRTGGWRTQLGVRFVPNSPAQQAAASVGAGVVAASAKTATNTKMGWAARKAADSWKMYESWLEATPVRTQGLALALIW